MMSIQPQGLVVSALKVMQSAAGFYVGRSCVDLADGNFEQPYSRESDYFATAEDAEPYRAYLEGE